MNIEMILILALTLFNSKDKESKELHILKDYITTIQIDPIYTQKKIGIVKKIAPLLPNKYLKPTNQSILYALSMVKIIEIKNIFDDAESIENASVPIKDNKDRLNKIMAILKEESLNTDFTNMSTAMNILMNLDKYKNLLNVFMKLNNDNGEVKDNTKLIEITQALMGDEKDGKDTKEMKKMIQIINLLNSPKKEDKSQAANTD